MSSLTDPPPFTPFDSARAVFKRNAQPTSTEQAVTRAGDGSAQVSVVGGQDRVHLRRVTLGPLVDGRYIIQSGLRAGETVIVEGQDRVQPGTPVNQRPWRGGAAS